MLSGIQKSNAAKTDIALCFESLSDVLDDGEEVFREGGAEPGLVAEVNAVTAIRHHELTFLSGSEAKLVSLSGVDLLFDDASMLQEGA